MDIVIVLATETRSTHKSINRMSSLYELRKTLSDTYGRRNRLYLQSLQIRINFLNLAVGDLHEVIRKQFKDHYPTSLARVVARIICITDHFVTLPLEELMARKYPSSHCSYCSQDPCQCREIRNKAKLLEVANKKQQDWGLREWSTHFDRIYGDKNRDAGLDYILGRLFKEVVELQNLQMSVIPLDLTPRELEEEFSIEIADVLAWTVGVANYLMVDLEDSVEERYGSGCWKCHKSVCECRAFNMMPVKWGAILPV